MMDTNKQHNKKIVIPILGIFLIAVIVIMYFFPREAKNKYFYAENRPWQYGLFTAPFNFFIQKSETRLQTERDSVMESFQPYYSMNSDVEAQMTSLFEKDARANSVNEKYIYYVKVLFKDVYKAGIISVEDYDKIQEQSKKQLLISREDNVYSARHIASLYTPRLAYDKILNDVPSGINVDKLKGLNLNDYLNSNTIYDENTSSKAKEEMLKQISLYEGEVQQGEKIIDRGEIVTSNVNDILDSYFAISSGGDHSKNKPLWQMLGEFILVSMSIGALVFYLRYYRPKEYLNRKTVVFILLMVTLPLIMLSLLVYQKLFYIVYIVPFAIPTILVRTFIDSRTAMTTHIVTLLIGALMLPIAQAPQFLIIQLLVGYTSIFSLRKLSERSQLIYCSLLILSTYILAFTGWLLITEGNWNAVVENKRMYICFCINFVFVSFAYLLVYVCERIFGYISEVTMIELSNTNRPLLQRLSEVAPGTFQHSMQVSNLVVPAAVKVGANPALARVGALYHDIGKMTNAVYFTENQVKDLNPHKDLDEKESARIIIDHVNEGVRIAKKNKLPQQIIDFIETHHGRGKAKYFYNSYVNKHPDEEIDPADFTYPGPNPFSKETALLMMADIVEAASRSLSEYTPDSIRGLIDRLINTQLDDGLLRNAPLTFKDIEDVKEIFCEKLVTIYHTRISYPELNKTKQQ